MKKAIGRDLRSGFKDQISELNVSVALASLDRPVEADGDLVWKEGGLALKVSVEKPRALIDGGACALSATVSAKLINLEYAGQVNTRTPASLEGGVHLAVPSLRKLAAWSGTAISATGETLGPLDIRGKVKVAGPKVSFSDAEIVLDAIRGSGSISVTTDDSTPGIEGSVHIDHLDFNPYLLVSEDAAAGASAGAGWSEEAIDVAGLKALDANIALTLGGLQIRQIQIGKTVTTVRLQGGRLSLDLSSFSLYQGQGQGKLTLDGSQMDSVGIDLSLQMGKIQLLPFLRDAGGLDRVSGVGGLGLAAMSMHVATAFVGGDPAEKTEFSEMGGTFTITGGVLKNSYLTLKSPVLHIEGAGSVDLNRRYVDYRVIPRFVAPLVGQLAGNLLSVRVPVLNRGPWDRLSYSPDMTGIVRQGLETPGNLVGDVIDLPGAILRGGKPREPATEPGDNSGEKPEADPSLSKSLDALKGLFGR